MLIFIESCLGWDQAGLSCSSPKAIGISTLGKAELVCTPSCSTEQMGKTTFLHSYLKKPKTQWQTILGEVKYKVMPVRRKI